MLMSGRKLVLLSIHPVYVARILAGTKTVELRRARPNAGPRDWLLFYATWPTQAIVAAVRIERIVADAPARLWPDVRDHCGLTAAQYRAYYRGAEAAVGVWLGPPRRLASPILLRELRASLPGFRPPRGFAYYDLDRGPMNALRPRLIEAVSPAGAERGVDIPAAAVFNGPLVRAISSVG